MTSRLSLALQPAVVRRSLGYALVVGVVLISINHGDAIAGNDVSGARVLKMVLTVVVPDAVSTASSVAAIRELTVGEGRGSRRG